MGDVPSNSTFKIGCVDMRPSTFMGGVGAYPASPIRGRSMTGRSHLMKTRRCRRTNSPPSGPSLCRWRQTPFHLRSVSAPVADDPILGGANDNGEDGNGKDPM